DAERMPHTPVGARPQRNYGKFACLPPSGVSPNRWNGVNDWKSPGAIICPESFSTPQNLFLFRPLNFAELRARKAPFRLGKGACDVVPQKEPARPRRGPLPVP